MSADKNHHPIRNSSLLLLIAEIFLIISSIWWADDRQDRPWLHIIYTVLFCAGGYALAQSKYWLRIYIPLAVIAVSFSLDSESTLHIWLHSIAILCMQMMLFVVIIHHSFFKLQVPRVDRIIAGVTGYILLGLFWNTQMSILTSLGTKPLLHQLTTTIPSLSDSLYFTFVSFTTLGYGDIIPVTPAAKIITLFNALTGTLYLAIFISSLISNSKEQ